MSNIIDLGSLGEVELIHSVGDDLTVVNSARISYGKTKTELDDKDIKLINYLIKNNHVSTLEHTLMTFRVKAPKPIIVQWFRHKSQCFNEVSGRYVEFEEEFYYPDEFRVQSDSSKQASIEAEWSGDKQYVMKFFYEEAIKQGYARYKSLLNMGVAKEQARMVLPFGFMSEAYISMNLRSFLHWYEARSHEHSQWEIRCFANAVYDLVEPLYPNTIKAFKDRNNV